MEKHNGWTNWETWLVNLHFSPSNKEEARNIEEIIEEEIEYLGSKGTMPLLITDVLANFLNEVNFEEIIDKSEDGEDGE